MRRSLLLAVAAVGAAAVLAGCFQTDKGLEGKGSDPSLPGVEVSGRATWDGKAWTVTAEAVNRGDRTYRIDAGCSSPFGLEARADGGEPYQEVRCLAYTEPVPFPPGQSEHRGWTVDPEPLHWSGDARFAVTVQEAEGTGQVRVALA